MKSAFGYHVIELEELRGPEFSDFVKRLDAAAGTDTREGARGSRSSGRVPRGRKRRRSSRPPRRCGSQQIVVNLPRRARLRTFTEALKISTVTGELAKGTDAGSRSDPDDATAEKGGELGWVARGTLGDYRAEQELFTLDAGKVSTQYSASSATTIYKVLEKDPARALTDDQRDQIKAQAYDYWLAKLKQERGVRKLVPGHELD